MKYSKPNYRFKEIFSLFFLFAVFSTSTASYGQQTGCPNDFDCDGIIDALDVDDDNDGIYDHIESPNCFYLDRLIHQTGDRRIFIDPSTTLAYTVGSPDLLVDGTLSGITIPAATALTGQEIVRLNSTFLGGIEYSSIILAFNATAFFTASSRVVMQGSQDGNNWTDLTEVVKPAVTAVVSFPITKNRASFKIYRILGVEGLTGGQRILTEITTTVGAYMPSLFPKANCEGEDIDGDGKPNHQDFDADGDGGADVIEAGFADDDNDGMLGSSPVTVNQYGAVTSASGYTFPRYFYKTAGINATVDTDGDGIVDVYDLDDDNDGIYDHLESPNCFYLDKTIYETGDRRSLLVVSTDLPYTTGSTDLIVDGIANTGLLITLGAKAVADVEIVRIATQLTYGIEYSSLTIAFSRTSFFTSSSRVVLQGSSDGALWEDLTEIFSPTTTSAIIKIPITKNQGLYASYRLLGKEGTINGDCSINEVSGVVGAYMPSLYPKASCTGEDIDGDGKPNHQDLDADEDGDFDVIEAGFSDPDRDGILGSSPVTVDQFGVVQADQGYITPYEYYKTAQVIFTTDTDGDGVVDLFDVDDDNDGIYDHVESPSCFYLYKKTFESGDRTELFDASTTLPYTAGNTDLLINGTTTDGGITVAASTPLTGKEVIRLTTKLARGIEFSDITLSFNMAAFFVTSSRVVLQGSQDGNTWTDLTEVITPSMEVDVPFAVTKNQDVYRMYRVLGTAGISGGLKVLTEVTAAVGAFIPSLYPKLNCIGEDQDGDGILNHHDLNADGDNCNDVIEAGFLDPDRDGILGASPVTVDQYGQITSAVGYSTPNNFYFLDATKNVCTGEGIPIDEDSHCIDMENITNDYGLVQSTFHSTMVRTKTGFAVFGEYSNAVTGGHHLSPVDVIPANGYPYEGTIIAGSLGGFGNMLQPNQYFVLSTAGLYTWGSLKGVSVPASWTTSTRFQKIIMPEGVAPRDVKFMSATNTNLVLLTKSGDVYVATGGGRVGSIGGYGAYGDGSTREDALWHKSEITQVVSVKVNSFGQVMALTHAGELFTWGLNVVLGDGTPIQNLFVPTKMTLPAGITSVKMTALTSGYTVGISVSYFVLGNDKRVYSLGGNTDGLLGIDSTTPQLTWQTVKGVDGVGYLENIKFINASIHDTTKGAAAAIDVAGMPYIWGSNGNMGVSLTPKIPLKSNPEDYDIIYIELGGHVTPIIDKGLGKFGYVGHKVNGSMGDGSEANSNILIYDFENTPFIDFCNIVIGGPKITRVMVNPMNINSKPRKN
ncbi:hypothetical protein [Flavobacterium sp. JP2137]|uniref:hypothetical protein n=1 Tax=Flavobacterium sp. JP2137 TaxID=3414510 RepID=UPI003D2FAF81